MSFGIGIRPKGAKRGAYAFTFLAAVVCFCGCAESVQSERQRSEDRVTLAQLFAAPDLLAQHPIQNINLVAAENLNNGVAILEVERELLRMASRVKSETDRNFQQFQQNPGNYENSRAFFNMLVLATVLHEDFGVKYNPAKVTAPGAFQSNDSFFSDPRDVFIHGLLSGSRQGTCSSIPVLYVAVGRKLGYPLKLVTAKNHLFVRWEDATERRNFEVTGNGLNSFDDNYYREWPVHISPDEEKQYGYLHSLTPLQEFGVFLSIRASCLLAQGKIQEGNETMAKAKQFIPIQASHSN